MKIETRNLGLGGIGPITAMADALGERWFDCDRARVTDSDTLAPWPGWRRRGTCLFNEVADGAAGDRLQITRFSPNWMGRPDGHALAILDRSTNTAGRVVALAHQTEGRFADLIGEPENAGLETGGAWAPAAGQPATQTFRVQIVNAPGLNEVDTFTWSIDDGDTWYNGGAGIDITGDWQIIGQSYGTGLLVKFAATTGHEVGDYWHFTVGDAPQLAGTMNRQGPHQYPALAQHKGRTYIYDPWNPVLVDDGRSVRRAGIMRPAIRPVVVGYDATTALTGNTDADPVEWTALDAAVTVSRDTTNKYEGTACVKLVLDDALAGKRAWPIARLETSGYIQPGTPTMKMWFYAEVEGSSGTAILPKNVEVVFAENADGTGKKFAAPVWDTSITQNAWDQLTLGIPSFGFYYRSVTLQINFPLTAAQFSLEGGTVNLYLDTMALSDPETPSEDLTDVVGEWAFCFTWYDAKRGIESAPSPYTPPMPLTGSQMPILSLGGDNAVTAAYAGLANAAPAGVDAVHIYAANTLFGEDPRLGGLSFFRISPDGGVALTELTTEDTHTLCYSLANIPFSVEQTPDAGPRHPFYLDVPKGAALAIEDGQLIVSCGRPAYRVGTWNKTNNSYNVTPVSGTAATTPIPNDWMVGRRCHFLGDDKHYTVVKVLANGLFLAGKWNPDTQEWEEPYGGTTGTGVLEFPADSTAITWTNNTSERGVDADTASVLNRLEVLPGDEIVGGGKVGEFLWLVGRKGAAIVRQEPGALADDPSQAPYANPIAITGVTMIGPRAWASLPSGGAAIITARGELAMLTGTAAQLHDASPNVAAFLSGYAALASPDDLARLHLSFHKTSDGPFLYVGLPGPAGTVGLNGVRPRSANQWDGTNPGEPAAGDGDQINVSALTRDYEFGLWIDLTRNIVTLATECRFPCLWGEYGGDRDGFVARLFDENWLSWGSPDEAFVFTAVLDGETVVLDATLTVNQLVGLVAAKRTGTTVEYRRIASNTANTITPSANWTSALAVGDIIYVGPLAWMVHFSESRAPRIFTPRALIGNYDAGTVPTTAGVTVSTDAIVTVDTFGADGSERRVSDLGAEATKTALAASWTAGVGRLYLSPTPRKALSYRLSVLGGNDGPSRVRNLAIEERVSD